jgi:hypothetical protein
MVGACSTNGDMKYSFVRKLKETDRFVNLDIDGRIIFIVYLTTLSVAKAM